MTVDELMKIDESFTIEDFFSMVSNTYVMLLSSIMEDNIARVKHRLTKNVIKKIEDKLLLLEEKNRRQIYENLEIRSIEINKIYEDENNYYIEVLLVSRYSDYEIDKNTLKLIEGFRDVNERFKNLITFKKAKHVSDNSSIRKCPNCGANIDINYSGVCPYCRGIFDTYNHDWILSDFYISIFQTLPGMENYS